jgi:hypothetical protein
MDVEALKKTARAAAKAAGTSHQSELNRIAQERGHTHWGALLAAAVQDGDGLPAGSYMDSSFDPPRAFLPIAGAPRDGTRLLVVGGSTYAAATWRSGMWTYPSGGPGEPDTVVQLEVEPTHYMRRDDADAEAQTISAQTPRMLRGLVERMEGLPELELAARMMLGAQFHLHAAESRARWTRRTGPRPSAPTQRPDGIADREWLTSLVERAERVDVDPEALDTLRGTLERADMEDVVLRNGQLIERMLKT